MQAVPVPLREDFSFDADAFIARMQAENPALVFIAYPNNPTGVLYPEADIVKVIRACKGLVVARRGLPRVRRQELPAAARRVRRTWS